MCRHMLLLVLVCMSIEGLPAIADAPSSSSLTTVSPVGRNGCPLTGVFMRPGQDGQMSVAKLAYIPRQVRVSREADAVPFSVAAYTLGDQDYVELVLSLEVVEDDSARRCIDTTYPGSTVTAVQPLALKLDFLPSLSGLSSSVQSDGFMDLFARAQWIGVTLHAKNLFQVLRRNDIDAVVGSIITGSVLWSVPGTDGGRTTVRSGFRLPDSDAKAILQAIRQQVKGGTQL